MPTESLLFAALGIAVWLAWLWSAGKLPRRITDIPVEIRPPHAVQLVLQFSLYVYWSLYWNEVGRRAPLIAAQIVFAYFLEMCLTWSRGHAWRFRLAPFPVIFSLNLFLWFRDEFFFLQLALVAFAYLCKEFITWEQAGRRAHIFNPSAFPLAVTSILLMATDTIGLSYGLDLIWSFYPPPHFYEVIFLLGLVVQFLFGTTWITFGAAAMLCALHGASYLVLGTTVAPHPFDAAVFLGLTLLVTDPVTSPRGACGKLVFGLIYGALVFAAYVGLHFLHQPSYFDKILMVPIVNLLVPWCEAAGIRLWGAFTRLGLREWSWSPRLVQAAYAAFFLAISPVLKAPRTDFEDPLPASRIDLSAPMADLRIRALTFRLLHPDVYAPFTFGAEWRHYQDISQFSPDTPEELIAMGRVLLDYHRPQEALSALEAAVSMAPELPAARQYLGQALLRSGKSAAAVRELERSLELQPENPDAHRDLGAALGMERQFSQAIEHLEISLARNPRDFSTQFNLGGARMGTGDLEGAVAHLRAAVSLKPGHGLARLQLGSALAALGQREEARVHLQRAALLMPSHEGAKRLLHETTRTGSG